MPAENGDIEKPVEEKKTVAGKTRHGRKQLQTNNSR